MKKKKEEEEKEEKWLLLWDKESKRVWNKMQCGLFYSKVGRWKYAPFKDLVDFVVSLFPSSLEAMKFMGEEKRREEKGG